MWLIFEQVEAWHQANAMISYNMRLDGTNTKVWAGIAEEGTILPIQRLDGKYAMPKPEVQFLLYVTGYTEEGYDAEWFPVVDGE